jgi:hypothetical protein
VNSYNKFYFSSYSQVRSSLCSGNYDNIKPVLLLQCPQV